VVRIVQVSDTHLSRRTPEASANWSAIVDHLTADPPDLIVNTGDVSLDGANEATDLEYAYRAHKSLPAPWRAIPGNHDVGDIGATTDPTDSDRRARFADVFGDPFWIVPCGGWDVVGVDIQAMAAPTDAVEPAWEWLGRALTTNRPVMLCMHRPLMPFSAGESDEPRRYLTGDPRERLRTSIETSSVRIVATGHVHQSRQVTVDGCTHVWAPSTWATLPDDAQPVIGTKVVGFVEYRLGSDATATTAVPDGVHQHIIGTTIPMPYAH
jgi:3',5'-cyclic AMP phosphodiesterase CpdA